MAISVEGKPFAVFHYGADANKPYLSPLRSASGKVVTRLFPMEVIPGVPQDLNDIILMAIAKDPEKPLPDDAVILVPWWYDKPSVLLFRVKAAAMFAGCGCVLYELAKIIFKF